MAPLAPGRNRVGRRVALTVAGACARKSAPRPRRSCASVARSGSGMGKWCLGRGRSRGRAYVSHVLEYVGGQPQVAASDVEAGCGAIAGDLPIRRFS